MPAIKLAIGVTGFEPTTSASQKQRSTKLSYTPLFVFVYDHYTQDWNHCQEVTQDKQEQIIV